MLPPKMGVDTQGAWNSMLRFRCAGKGFLAFTKYECAVFGGGKLTKTSQARLDVEFDLSHKQWRFRRGCY